jgi:hypothetical protein
MLAGLVLFFSARVSATNGYVFPASLAGFFDMVTGGTFEGGGESDATENMLATSTATATPTPTFTGTPLCGGGTWAEQAHPTPSDGMASDLFGNAVAISGDTAVVGAVFADTAGGTNAGAAYVYVRSGSVWAQQQKLTASDGAGSQKYGISVAISGDTIIVGAQGNGTTDAGAAYVYTRSGTVWTQQQKLTASDGAAADLFGYSVSITNDTAVVGAILDDNGGGADAGSAYVFARSGTVWTQQQKLMASDGAATDKFGNAVAISGETVVIGARENDAPFTDTGSAYVFTRSAGVWSQQQKLTASDAATGDQLGYSVAIYGDRIVTGAQSADTFLGTDAGAAYVFLRSGTVWSQTDKLFGFFGTANDHFGQSVSISNDRLVVGGILGDTTGGTDAGYAWVFKLTNATWKAFQRITASDGAAADEFGVSVAIDGDTSIVGAESDDTPGGTDAGSIYVFKDSCALTPTPSATATFTPTPTFTSTATSTATTTFTPTPTFTPTVTNTTTSTPTASPTGIPAITAYDAGLYAMQISLNANQIAALEVSGNCVLNVNDQFDILGYVVKDVPVFNTGTTINPPGPCPGFPISTSVLLGDPSGTAPGTSGGVPGSPGVSLPDVTTVNSMPGVITVPVTVGDLTGLGVISYEFQVTFDPAVVTPSSALLSGTMSASWAGALGSDDPGHLIVAAATTSGTALTGSGTLLNLQFNVIGSPGQSTALTFEGFTGPGGRFHPAFLFNEGTPTGVTTNGSITISTAPPPSPSPTNTGTATGTPTPTTALNAITSFDASWVVREALGEGVLTTNEHKVAADVSGNCNISTLDSFDISLYVIGLTGGTTGTTISPPGPCPGFPITTNVLRGDVTGVVPVLTGGSPGTPGVILPVMTAPPGMITVPIAVGNLSGLDVRSYDFQVTFDSAVLMPASPAFSTSGTLSSSGTVNANTSNPGHLIISGFNYSPMINSGTLLNLLFNVVGSPGQSTTLVFEDYTDPGSRIHQSFIFNEGVPTANRNGGNGSITLTAASPTNTSTPTATLTPTSTATTTPTGSGTPSIGGVVTYGNAIVAGATPTPRLVRNVTVQSTAGSPMVGPVITGTPGTYTLTGFGATSYTIKPSKPGGANTAITSADAARVAQGVAGSVPFVSQNQRFAADTSGNGGPNPVTSNDAALIAKFVAGLTGFGRTGSWFFFLTGAPSPMPTAPATYNDHRDYASVTSNLTGEDYVAILVGETTGNYNPANNARPATGPENSVSVEIPQIAAETGKEVILPVRVEGAVGKNITSYEFDLRYDPNVIQPLTDPVDVAKTASRGLSFVANPYEPGLLRVVMYGAFPIDSEGVLLNLRFTAVGKPGALSPLTFERVLFNEGEPGATIADGRIEIL